MAQPDSGTTGTTQSDSFLFKLPLELRLSVYDHVMGPMGPSTTLHITENEKSHRLKSIPCTAPPENTPGIQHRPTSDPQRRWESIHKECQVRTGRPWERPQTFGNTSPLSIKPSLARIRDLLSTCKQIHSEAIHLLYSPIIFELSNLSTIHRFLTIPQHSLEHIQNLDIGWAVRGFCTYQRPGSEDFWPEEYRPENHRKWIEVCTSIKKMRGMKYLRIRIYRPWGMRLMERELLEPLTGPLPGFSIEREDFVVEVPKRVAGDRECDLMDEDSSEGTTRFKIVRT